MSDFVENNKFLGLSGVLGRRGFISNWLLIEVFESIYLTLVYVVMSLSPFLDSVNVLIENFIAFNMVVGFISICFFYSSIVRRVRDIFAIEDNNKTYLIATTLAVLSFIAYTPLGMKMYLGVLSIIILLFLLCTKGQITGEKPVDEVKKFNWAAFLGTWIWGLKNKVYKPLWMLPLLFTFSWLPFMLICGINGNEWAYNKNKEKFDEIPKFHEEQKKQIGFVVIILLALNICLSVFTGLGLTYGLRGYFQKHPEANQKLLNWYAGYHVTSMDSTFDKIEVENGVYKFYMHPEDWTLMNDTLRNGIISQAVRYSLIKNEREYLTFDAVLQSLDIANTVKIYSIFNNEELGAFYIAPEEVKGFDFKNLNEEQISKIKEILPKAYKKNNNPTVPDAD